MKTLLSIPLFMFTSSVVAQTSPAAGDSLFIVTYTTGPAWDSSKAPGEQSNFKEHSANLGAWRKEGAIKFGARYGDKGIIFIAGVSGAAIRERILGDPGVSSGLFRADIQKLSPFYFGCIEKPQK